MSVWNRLYGPLIGVLSTLVFIGAICLILRMWDMNPAIEITLPSPTPSLVMTSVVTPTSRGSLININTASSELLETLPGIGEVRAKRIVDHRSQYGSFQSPNDLVDKKLIPLSVYEQIKDRLTVN